MFITPAYAQSAGGGGGDLLISIIPFILIFVIMWLFILRPQRQKMKAHEEMVNNVRRGDTIVTNGGIVGKVTKVHDEPAEVEIDMLEGKARVVRAMIADVRSKGEPK